MEGSRKGRPARRSAPHKRGAAPLLCGVTSGRRPVDAPGGGRSVRWPPSLKVTFVLSLIGFVVVLSLTLALVAAHRVSSTLYEQMVQRGDSLAMSLAREAARFLDVEDPMERELSLMLLTYRLTVGDVAYAQVVDQGRTVSQSVQDDPEVLDSLPPPSGAVSGRKLQASGREYVDFIRFLPGGGENSFVRLGISMAAVHGQARRTLIMMAGLSLLFTVLGAGLAFLLYSAILKPLERVVVSIRSLAAGHWHTRAPLQGSRELRELASAFNGMARVIAERTRELHQVNAELRSANRAKAEFLAMIGHELKTPLHSVRGYCQLLLEELDGPLSPGQRADLEAILAAGNHLLALIDNILKFTASGDDQVHRTWFPLPTLLEQAANHVRPLAHRRKVQLQVDAGAVDEVYADETKLKQVLINLLHNAVKYSPAGSPVQMVAGTAGTEAGGFWVAVDDAGPGIAREDRERVFEPFERGRPEAEDRELKGLGLGLAVVRRYVEAHGGSVTVESAPLGGSRFRIVVPASGASADKPASSRDPGLVREATSARVPSQEAGGVA